MSLATIVTSSQEAIATSQEWELSQVAVVVSSSSVPGVGNVASGDGSSDGSVPGVGIIVAVGIVAMLPEALAAGSAKGMPARRRSSPQPVQTQAHV